MTTLETDTNTAVPPSLMLNGLEAHIGKNIFIRTVTNYSPACCWV